MKMNSSFGFFGTVGRKCEKASLAQKQSALIMRALTFSCESLYYLK